MQDIDKIIQQLKQISDSVCHTPNGAELNGLINDLQEAIRRNTCVLVNPVTAKAIVCPRCKEKIVYKVKENP